MLDSTYHQRTIELHRSRWEQLLILEEAGVALIGSESSELLAQAALVRDIFGLLPFRHFSVDPAWLTPMVVALANEIYAENAFDRLPELADALEMLAARRQKSWATVEALGRM